VVLEVSAQPSPRVPPEDNGKNSRAIPRPDEDALWKKVLSASVDPFHLLPTMDSDRSNMTYMLTFLNEACVAAPEHWGLPQVTLLL
jgi:hypothetical protein